MAEFKKKKTNSFWHSPLALGILFCVVVLFIYSMVGLIQKERETAQKKSLILDQIDTLHKREVVLNNDISKLETDEGVEETIRDKYQLAKPNEKMVIIVDDQKEPAQTPEEKNDHSFWSWVKKLFSK